LAALRRTLLLVGCCALVVPVGGCALGRKNVVPESLATCRQLSREGVSAMEAGQWQRAETLLTEAVEASPSDSDAHGNLAEVLWQKGDHRNAVIHMEAAVRLNPRHATTLVRDGEMLLAEGDVERARQRADEALRIDPTLASAWTLRGRVFRKLGDTEHALADLQQAFSLARSDTTTLIEIAQIQYESGNTQQSLTTLHCLLDIYPPGEEPQQALLLEGMAYNSLSRYQEAVESLQAASTRGQPQPEILYQLARAEQMVGEREAATNTLRQALALDANHEPSRVLLAQIEQHEATAAAGEVLRR
jgi:tetratricopeptide (TPR) repeat protein